MDTIESRVLRIEDKKITLKDVQKLAKIVADEFEFFYQTDKYANIRYQATCDDDSTFSSTNLELFDDDSVLASKRVLEIKINFSSYENHLSIDIRLRNEVKNSVFGSRIEVSGNNSNWVNGVLNRLNETVNSFTPQNTFIHDYRYVVNLFVATGIGLIYYKFVGLIPFEPNDNQPEWANQINDLVKEIPLIFIL